jgi:hypothetical protein
LAKLGLAINCHPHNNKSPYNVIPSILKLPALCAMPRTSVDASTDSSVCSPTHRFEIFSSVCQNEHRTGEHRRSVRVANFCSDPCVVDILNDLRMGILITCLDILRTSHALNRRLSNCPRLPDLIVMSTSYRAFRFWDAEPNTADEKLRCIVVVHSLKRQQPGGAVYSHHIPGSCGGPTRPVL